MGLSQLTGTPWHKDRWTREEGDPRRHRGNCIYHRKDNKCTYHKMNCYGSAHCDKYRVAPPESVVVKKSQPIDMGTKPIKKDDLIAQAKRQLPIGSRVDHKRFGEGLVERYEGDEVLIHFYDYGKKRLNLDSCLSDNLLVIID